MYSLESSVLQVLIVAVNTCSAKQLTDATTRSSTAYTLHPVIHQVFEKKNLKA